MKLKPYTPDWIRLQLSTDLETEQLERVRIIRGSQPCNRKSRFQLFDDQHREDDPPLPQEQRRMDLGTQSEFMMRRDLQKAGFDIRHEWGEYEGQFMIHSDVYGLPGTDELFVMIGHPDGYIRSENSKQPWQLLELKTTNRDDFKAMQVDFRDPRTQLRQPYAAETQRYMQQMKRYVAMTVLAQGKEALRIPQPFSQNEATLAVMCRDTGEMVYREIRMFDDFADPAEWLTANIRTMLENERPWKPTNYFADTPMCQQCAFYDECYDTTAMPIEEDADLAVRNAEIASLYYDGNDMRDAAEAQRKQAQARAASILYESDATKTQLTENVSISMITAKHRARFDEEAMISDGVLDKYKIDPGTSYQYVRFNKKRGT